MSVYLTLPEQEKARIRANALAYYHRNKHIISVKRKRERDTDPTFKIKRAEREKKYVKTRRTYHLRRKYGITLNQWNELFERQQGKCAICLVDFSKIGAKHIHLDHNHSTGQLRELLCNGCNCALGNLNENILLLENAIKYLTKWNKHE